jgi:hypothetical protein
MARKTAAVVVVETAQDLVTRLVNKRTGFLLHLSEAEKATLRAAADGQPLAAWIRETVLEVASRREARKAKQDS